MIERMVKAAAAPLCKHIAEDVGDDVCALKCTGRRNATPCMYAVEVHGEKARAALAAGLRALADDAGAIDFADLHEVVCAARHLADRLDGS